MISVWVKLFEDSLNNWDKWFPGSVFINKKEVKISLNVTNIFWNTSLERKREREHYFIVSFVAFQNFFSKRKLYFSNSEMKCFYKLLRNLSLFPSFSLSLTYFVDSWKTTKKKLAKGNLEKAEYSSIRKKTSMLGTWKTTNNPIWFHLISMKQNLTIINHKRQLYLVSLETRISLRWLIDHLRGQIGTWSFGLFSFFGFL